MATRTRFDSGIGLPDVDEGGIGREAANGTKASASIPPRISFSGEPMATSLTS